NGPSTSTGAVGRSGTRISRNRTLTSPPPGLAADVVVPQCSVPRRWWFDVRHRTHRPVGRSPPVHRGAGSPGLDARPPIPHKLVGRGRGRQRGSGPGELAGSRRAVI